MILRMKELTPWQTTLFIWAAASAALMLVGAIGPWAVVLSVVSIGGLDGGNDGWIVVVVAAAALIVLCAFALGASRRLVWPLPVLGLAGLAVTAIDRRDVSELRDDPGVSVEDILTDNPSPGPFAVDVGWGLNLAMGASFSLVVASGVLLLAERNR
jgi:hypothetical protein